jgi:hypothetical protein
MAAKECDDPEFDEQELIYLLGRARLQAWNNPLVSLLALTDPLRLYDAARHTSIVMTDPNDQFKRYQWKKVLTKEAVDILINLLIQGWQSKSAIEALYWVNDLGRHARKGTKRYNQYLLFKIKILRNLPYLTHDQKSFLNQAETWPTLTPTQINRDLKKWVMVANLHPDDFTPELSATYFAVYVAFFGDIGVFPSRAREAILTTCDPQDQERIFREIHEACHPAKWFP